MSGHSKWSKIKRQKAVNDQKKGQVFSKYARAITLAVKEGGDNPDFNFNLRLLIDKAKASGMPNNNIEKALQRGVGGGDEAQLSRAVYEAFGTGGVGLIIESASDNPNRAVMEVKRILSKHSAQMGASGSVTWMFNQRGVILATPKTEKEEVSLAAIDAGAVDVKDTDDGLEIYTEPKNLMAIKNVLTEKIEVETAQIAWVPNQEIEADKNIQNQTEKLIEALEDLDDVTEVYSNLANPL